MPSCNARLRVLNLSCHRRPSNRKIISSLRAICRITKMTAGSNSRQKKFTYTARRKHPPAPNRSEEHTSELQSLMRISDAVFCLKKKKYNKQQTHYTRTSSRTTHK